MSSSPSPAPLLPSSTGAAVFVFRFERAFHQSRVRERRKSNRGGGGDKGRGKQNKKKKRSSSPCRRDDFELGLAKAFSVDEKKIGANGASFASLLSLSLFNLSYLSHLSSHRCSFLRKLSGLQRVEEEGGESTCRRKKESGGRVCCEIFQREKERAEANVDRERKKGAILSCVFTCALGDDRALVSINRSLSRGVCNALTDLWKVENQPKRFRRGAFRLQCRPLRKQSRRGRSIEFFFFSRRRRAPPVLCLQGGSGLLGTRGRHARVWLACCFTNEKGTRSRFNREREGAPSPRVAGEGEREEKKR